MKFLFIVLFFSCFISCKEKFDTKTYQENKESLAQRESGHPEQFLKISSNGKKNLFGATVVKGKIVNTATVAAYKNARVKMLCYKNGIRVEEHEDVMPDVMKPGTVHNFKIKYRLPKGTDSLALSIMSADAVTDTVSLNK
ncbi:MAG: hypothetical protein JO072_10285 [Parafilimonas sp.]|nr:hypothetical protein [Parafilimonas sp.]